MKIGMLWFDNSKDELSLKVARAVEYYAKKYGSIPNLCYINPWNGEPGKVNDVEIRNSRSVLPNHFWIGVNNEAKIELQRASDGSLPNTELRARPAAALSAQG